MALRRCDVVEADAGVDREVPRHPPVVLREELGVHELAVRRGMGVRLLVLRHGAEQRVGEADVRVERVRAVGVEASVPLNAEERCAGRVVCSTKIPVFRLCAPFTLVRLPRDVEERVVAVERPKRLLVRRTTRWCRGTPPVKLACGSRLSGFAVGKNCGIPGSTWRAIVDVERRLVERRSCTGATSSRRR